MAVDVLPAEGTQFGDRVRQRLRTEEVVWLTTVGADGAPQPNPVWFLWEGETVLVYTRPDAHRLEHIRQRPQVALHFNSDGSGGDIVVIKGTAQIADDEVLPSNMPAYLDKYAEAMELVVGGVEPFAAQYPVAVRVRLERVRGY
ncbi:TIGR03667 family PPOX class F420-dependent oxidoreductase [Prauserella oleivorans]|uniref:TIGR03667 family PPOX class F420-dependent oxidoreductase n=1 Tax=Prauserella oleivorans TaxID=1478153 RepID=A0ABW5WA34_9PSEU